MIRNTLADLAADDRSTALLLLELLEPVGFDIDADHVKEPRTDPARRSWRRAAQLAGVAAAVAAIGIAMTVGGPQTVAPTWAAVPSPASPTTYRTVDKACRGMAETLRNSGVPDIPAHLPPLRLLDMRGTGAFALFEDKASAATCLAVRVHDWRPWKPSWVALSVGTIASAPHQNSLWIDVPGGGLMVEALFAKSPKDGKVNKFLGTRTVASYTSIVGVVPHGTARVEVILPTHAKLTATIVGRYFASWFPGRLEDSVGPNYNIRVSAYNAHGQLIATDINTMPWWTGYAPGVAPLP